MSAVRKGDSDVPFRLSSTPTRLLLLAATLAVAQPALAEVSEREAIAAQVASALASADFARVHCPDVRIDEARLGAQLKRTEKTAEQLRASEEYAEQKSVVDDLKKSTSLAMLCALLPEAHGGYARGIIVGR